jgi:hypothetical protein
MQKYSTAFENQLRRSWILQTKIYTQTGKFIIYMVTVVTEYIMTFLWCFATEIAIN